MLDQKLRRQILQEIGRLSKEFSLPISIDHLEHLSDEVDMLALLISMKDEGLIGGEIVRIGREQAAYRMTNIRLTYNGLKILHSLEPPFARSRRAEEG
jgi:hypothetical protein